MACGDLLGSFVYNCDEPLQGGVGGDSRLVMILKKDIDAYVKNGVDIITAITLASGKSAFSFDGIQQSLKPRFERVKNANGEGNYKHTIEFNYFGYSQWDKNNIARMSKGRYVCIHENAKQDANAFELLGRDVGLEMMECVRAPQENGGAVRIVMSSPENELESKPPTTFYDGTSYATTKAIIDGYLYLPTLTTIAPLAAAAAGGTALTLTGTNFYGGGPNNAVLKVEYVNNSTGAVVTQTTYTVASTTSITLNTVAMAAGSYKIRITTLKGVCTGAQNLIVT